MSFLATFAFAFFAGAGAGGVGSEPSMTERCEKEVVELHQFFQAWFGGVLTNDDDSLRRFGGVLAEGFLIVPPSGAATEREPLIERLRGAHGSWATGSERPGRIWIEKLRVRRSVEDWAIVTYEEWQEVGGETRGRISTAVFGRREGTPNGVEWLHVHETWLPDQS